MDASSPLLCSLIFSQWEGERQGWQPTYQLAKPGLRVDVTVSHWGHCDDRPVESLHTIHKVPLYSENDPNLLIFSLMDLPLLRVWNLEKKIYLHLYELNLYLQYQLKYHLWHWNEHGFFFVLLSNVSKATEIVLLVWENCQIFNASYDEYQELWASFGPSRFSWRVWTRAVDRILKSRLKSDLSDFLTGRKPLLLWSF